MIGNQRDKQAEEKLGKEKAKGSNGIGLGLTS